MADTYNPLEVIFTFGNKDLGSGIVEGTFITVNKTNDTRSFRIGSDGRATIMVNPDKSAIVEVTYRAGSLTNTVIEGLRQDEDAGIGIYRVGTLTIEDMNGTEGSRSFVSDENAFIMGQPTTTEYAQAESQKTWKWGLPAPTIQTHGTKSPPRIGEGNV